MKQPQNIPIICGPLSGKKFVQGKKVIKDLIENSYLFGGNAPYVEDLYEQYLEDPSSVDEKWRQYFDRLQQAPASDGRVETVDVPHAPIVEAFAQRASEPRSTVCSVSERDLDLAKSRLRFSPSSALTDSWEVAGLILTRCTEESARRSPSLNRLSTACPKQIWTALSRPPIRTLAPIR